MVLHWGTLLAPQGKDMGKDSHLVLDNVVLLQDIHQAAAKVSPLPMASMDQE